MHVFCSVAVERVMLECISAYGRENAVRSTVALGTTADLCEQIECGARGDLTVLTREALDVLLTAQSSSPPPALGSRVRGSELRCAQGIRSP
jgi:hypothetical protein